MNALTSPLLTDLYQLTMLEAYLSEGMEETAAFEFTVRDLPAARGFLVAAGLESLLSFLENLRFSEEEIAYLDGTGRFSRSTSPKRLPPTSSTMCPSSSATT